MKFNRLILILIALFLGCTWTVVATEGPVAAPVNVDTQRFRWKNNTIRVAVSSSLTRENSNIKTDSDVMGAIQRSLNSWQDVADIEFKVDQSDRQSVSPSGFAGDGVSLITIAQTPENLIFFSKDADSASAKTRIFYNIKGFITEADIVLKNAYGQFSTDGTFGTYDLESALTHEIGHLLGLRHSGVLGAMLDNFGKIGVFGIRDYSPRSLSASDVAAIRELYGPKADDEEAARG